MVFVLTVFILLYKFDYFK